MAGAGYKLFNTGDVLTAAQVNTYLQEQAVMRFANAAARTTALSGVLAEGMMSYLDDTNSVEVYNGSAWVSVSGDQTPLTTKGDLFTYTTQDARLGVGNNGETLVADSSASTGLRWQGNFAAGKNKAINGAFDIWQRGTSFTPTSNQWFYIADRFQSYLVYSSGTFTVSRQSFTPGNEIPGYEATYFVRHTAPTTASGGLNFRQNIEDVRTFAGQTVTISFWAKASTTTAGKFRVSQNFGSGGSGQVDTLSASFNIGTTWARYSAVISVPSISGKTIGTGNYIEYYYVTDNAFTGGATLDIWGCQIEAGNVATAFQTATGTLAGELQLAQRYYQVVGGVASGYPLIGGYSVSGTPIYTPIIFPVPMRTTPTITKNGTWETANVGQPSSLYISPQGFTILVTSSATGSFYVAPNSTDDTFTISAEL